MAKRMVSAPMKHLRVTCCQPSSLVAAFPRSCVGSGPGQGAPTLPSAPAFLHPPLTMSANNSRELTTLRPHCIDGQSYAVIYFTCTLVINAEGPTGARQTHISRMN